MIIPFRRWIEPAFPFHSTSGPFGNVSVGIDNICPEKIIGKDKGPDDGHDVEDDVLRK
jgi:hypothetical protein